MGIRTRTKLLFVESSHDSDPFSSTLKMPASLSDSRRLACEQSPRLVEGGRKAESRGVSKARALIGTGGVLADWRFSSLIAAREPPTHWREARTQGGGLEHCHKSMLPL